MKPGIFPAPSAGGGGQPTITTTTDELGSDVTMTTANTWYDGPSHALVAGTYLIEADAQVQIGSNNTAAMRIWDGTTVYAQIGGNSANYKDMHLAKVVVLGATTTVKLSCSCATSAATLKAADGTATGGGNTATRLSTLKLA